MQLAAGHYAYVGSALGGLEPRLRRHGREDKRFHWHIDYLLPVARIEQVVYAQTSQKLECRLADHLSDRFSSVPHFGSSDCGCPSHLFWSRERGGFMRAVRAAFEACGLTPANPTYPLKKSLT
jgi:Uri superfamily endonuclease